MKVFTVYRATNKLNGKCYVGFDSNWPMRKHMHHWLAKAKPQLQPAFHAALRKYGREDFQWDVLYQSLDGQHTHRIMEPFFINENRSFGEYGYNLTKGGDGVGVGHRCSEETRKKISEANIGNHHVKGYKHSEETRRKMSKVRKGWNPSEETRRKMSDCKLGNQHARKKICKI